MRPVRSLSLSAVGVSPPVVMDYRGSQFRVGLNIEMNGVNTCTAEMTFDDVFADNYNPATGNWLPVPIAALVGATADAAGLLETPCTAVRLNMTAWTSGSAQLRAVPVSGSVA